MFKNVYRNNGIWHSFLFCAVFKACYFSYALSKSFTFETFFFFVKASFFTIAFSVVLLRTISKNALEKNVLVGAKICLFKLKDAKGKAQGKGYAVWRQLFVHTMHDWCMQEEQRKPTWLIHWLIVFHDRPSCDIFKGKLAVD